MTGSLSRRLPVLALCMVMTACFLLGGSSRPDVWQAIVLPPIAALGLALGVVTIRRDQIVRHRFLFVMAGAIAALAAVQLLPLPPSVWTQIPGRELVDEIDWTAGLGGLWRPISLTPFETSGALLSLLVPGCVLVLACQFGEREAIMVTWLIAALGYGSAVLGLLQTLGPPDGPLYLYPVTNNGLAVGLLANRNHQALLLAMLLPALAALSVGTPARSAPMRVLCVGLALSLLPMILIAGSRMGLIAAAAAIAASLFVIASKSSSGQSALTGLMKGRRAASIAAGLACVAGVVLLTVLLGRDLALTRVLDQAPTADLRFAIIPALFGMIARYMPLGSGLGSFERTYLVHEPDALLGPAYMNHAHNDWLEALLTGGLPAALLMAAAVAAFVRTVMASRSAGPVQSLVLARLGLALIALAAIGSVTDYPLRVPVLAAIFTFGAVLAAKAFEGAAKAALPQSPSAQNRCQHA